MTNSLLVQTTSTKPLIETASYKIQAGSPKSDISESKKQGAQGGGILIKSFGNNSECHSLEEFKHAFVNYKGLCVTLIKVLASGIKCPIFVTVTNECNLIGTYTGAGVSIGPLRCF